MRKVFAGLVLAAAVSLSVPLSASAAEYETFVGCELAANAVPSHVCQLGDSLGAYFESDVDAEYEVCVEFPIEVVLCADEQLAEGGVLYVNEIFSELEGTHIVSWYVEGIEVGSWTFRLDPPPPPPVPIAPTPSVPPPAPVQPGSSVECLAAQQRFAKLKARLRKASGRKQKARLRSKLRSTRAATERLC
jgi:hypothetical protein